MKHEQSKAYYDTFSEIYEAERHHGYHRWLDERSVGLVASLARGREILEVGCGTGLILKETARMASRAVGLDLSPGMLEVARKRDLEVVEGSADDLPFDDASFDLVYSFKVLAHVPTLETALQEMARVTRPGGTLVLEFYNRNSLRWLVRRLRPELNIGAGKTEADVYTRFHSQAELEAMLPPDLTLERVEGMRVATLLPQVFRLPVVGGAWEAMENALSDSALRRFGGFLVLVLKKH
jgi:ubiquinone/menaquinone biosynthesis C-methylase UbiE